MHEIAGGSYLDSPFHHAAVNGCETECAIIESSIPVNHIMHRAYLLCERDAAIPTEFDRDRRVCPICFDEMLGCEWREKCLVDQDDTTEAIPSEEGSTGSSLT
jgi:hypothetical protein